MAALDSRVLYPGICHSTDLYLWRLPPLQDLKFFSKITKNHSVIMGRKTYDSLPDKFRPLPQRFNIVISSQNTLINFNQFLNQWGSGVLKEPFYVPSFQCALDAAKDAHQANLVQNQEPFVIGGSQVYNAAFERSEKLKFVYLTRVNSSAINCDTFLKSSALLDVCGWTKNNSRPPSAEESDFECLSVSETFSNGDITFDFVKLGNRSISEVHSSTNITPDPTNITVRDSVPSSKTNALSSDEILEFVASQRATNQKTKENCHFTKATYSCPKVYRSKFSHPEFQYLDLLTEIINNGFMQHDRTGVGTLTKFGVTMRFSLENSFPLLTTKTVFWRGIVEELLWFIKGSTSGEELSKKNIKVNLINLCTPDLLKIWDANGSREFLDSRGLFEREVGDLGPVYGFQWRHFGATYVNMHTDYSGQGVDQLRVIIDQLRNDRNSRRIILSAWNPPDLPKMALPPCHLLCQFLVSENSKLSCILYQRSADMGLGVPFNIASYSLLTLIIAKICNLEVGEFIHVLGNAHVYLSHVESLNIQVKRCPLPFPIVKIKDTVTDIDGISAKDVELIGYQSWPKIVMPMAV